MSAMHRPLTISRWLRYVSAVLAVGVGTTLILPFRQQINSTTVALGYLLVVLFVAILGRSGPALIASLLAMLCFNFFFLPPFHTFTIADPQNWVALTSFFVTALAVGQLSARARQRAEEAEAGRHEVKHLYEELQDAFERASQAEALYTLIDNASKYAPTETLIKVEANRITDDKIEIAVEDEGPGIPSQLRE